MHLEAYVTYKKEQPITDTNILELVVKKKNLKVRDYDSLSSKDSLGSLLPHAGSGCVLFWRNKKSEIGHFNLLMRHETSGPHDHKYEYEFFDSYGFTVQEVAAKTSHETKLPWPPGASRRSSSRVSSVSICLQQIELWSERL